MNILDSWNLLGVKLAVAVPTAELCWFSAGQVTEFESKILASFAEGFYFETC